MVPIGKFLQMGPDIFGCRLRHWNGRLFVSGEKSRYSDDSNRAYLARSRPDNGGSAFCPAVAQYPRMGQERLFFRGTRRSGFYAEKPPD